MEQIAGVTLVLGALVLSLAVVLRRTTLPARIVIGGLSGAGKTVFANVLYRQLSARASHVLAMTARNSVAEASLRVVREIESGIWPAETDPDEVREFEGVLEFRYDSQLLRALYSRYLFPFRLVDGAGNHWRRDADLSSTSMSSAMMTLTAKSKAIIYLVDLSECSDARDVEFAVESLRTSVVRLREILSIRPSAGLPQPVAVVIPKCDRLSSSALRDLELRFGATYAGLPSPKSHVRPETAPHRTMLKGGISLAPEVVERFESSLDEISRLCSGTRVFLASSVGEQFSGKGQVTPVGVVDPMAWVLGEIKRRRRSLARVDETFFTD